MRGRGVWQPICHYLFILATAVGWVVPWLTPHYYEAHPLRIRYSTAFKLESGGRQGLPASGAPGAPETPDTMEPDTMEEEGRSSAGRSWEVLHSARRI